MFYVSELFVKDKKYFFSYLQYFLKKIEKVKIFLKENVESEFQNGNFGKFRKSSEKGRRPRRSQCQKFPNFRKKISRTGGKLDKK